MNAHELHTLVHSGLLMKLLFAQALILNPNGISETRVIGTKIGAV